MIDKAEMHKMLTELQFCKREVIVATNSKKKVINTWTVGGRGKGERGREPMIDLLPDPHSPVLPSYVPPID